MSVAAIIVAAGRGTRAGGAIPKQFQPLAGKSVLAHSLEVFLSHEGVTQVLPVIHPEDRDLFDAARGNLAGADANRLVPPAVGGRTRQQSVRNGLEALVTTAFSPSFVLVHDAARPFVSTGLIDRAIAAGRAHGAAVPAIPVSDTIKLVGEDGSVAETPPRERLRAVQTPQAFAFAALLKAHRAAAEAGLDSFTDDAALAEWSGLPVILFDGDPRNTKLTEAGDLAEAERRTGGSHTLWITRVGTGFDVHAFGAGDHLWLGGVRIPYERGVVAHSDGDVVLHALTDAVLGALGEGDIGIHFPPSDPEWRGTSSARFLDFAAARVRARGGVVDHLDATILCEAPRIGPHREAMRQCIAKVAGLSMSSVSIKATTTEKLGFIGRSEGIAAQALATIRLPASEA